MDILSMTAVSLGAAIKKKEVTVREAVEAALDRIGEKEKEYHCFVTVDWLHVSGIQFPQLVNIIQHTSHILFGLLFFIIRKLANIFRPVGFSAEGKKPGPISGA